MELEYVMSNQNEKNELDRRSFLKIVSLPAAGGMALSLFAGKSLLGRGSRKKQQMPQFPEGSIFTPAKKYRDRI